MAGTTVSTQNAFGLERGNHLPQEYPQTFGRHNEGSQDSPIRARGGHTFNDLITGTWPSFVQIRQAPQKYLITEFRKSRRFSLLVQVKSDQI